MRKLRHECTREDFKGIPLQTLCLELSCCLRGHRSASLTGPSLSTRLPVARHRFSKEFVFSFSAIHQPILIRGGFLQEKKAEAPLPGLLVLRVAIEVRLGASQGLQTQGQCTQPVSFGLRALPELQSGYGGCLRRWVPFASSSPPPSPPGP